MSLFFYDIKIIVYIINPNITVYAYPLWTIGIYRSQQFVAYLYQAIVVAQAGVAGTVVGKAVVRALDFKFQFSAIGRHLDGGIMTDMAVSALYQAIERIGDIRRDIGTDEFLIGIAKIILPFVFLFLSWGKEDTQYTKQGK